MILMVQLQHADCHLIPLLQHQRSLPPGTPLLLLTTPTMASFSHTFESDQSFVTSLPLYTSPFLEQPFCTLTPHHTSSSSICSNLQDHSEVMNIQRVALHRSTANLVSLKESPPIQPRNTQSFWDFFTETSSNQAVQNHSSIEDDSINSDVESVSSNGSSSSFSTPSPSPIRNKSIMFNQDPYIQTNNKTDRASRYVRPHILVFKRPLSPIKQSSSTKSSDTPEQSPKMSHLHLASPFKLLSKKRESKQEADVDWTCSLDTSQVVTDTSHPCIGLSSFKTQEHAHREKPLMHSKSESDLYRSSASNCIQPSDSLHTPPFCGVSLPFARRSKTSRDLPLLSTLTSSPSLLSPSSKYSPTNTIHRSPSVSFADLVEITSALLAAPPPQLTPP